MTISLFGAGGKMGCRIADNLVKTEHEVRYVEVSPAGIERLAARGLRPSPHETAVAEADVAILALPDNLIGRVAPTIVPGLKSGAMLICLDPAAPFGEQLPDRQDITYFVTHPCHPPVVNDEVTPEAKNDFFGGIAAKQHIVCALMQGPESDYAKGEQVCREMFAPVMRAHRVTVEQMAILEPALSETTVATCMTVIREAIDEAVRRGVPEEAAIDFILGHINVNIGILFGYIGSPFSDGALKAIERGKKKIIRDDWKTVFEPENVMADIKAIVHATTSSAKTS
ncbi:MAG TPA: phosphogluconate dehydrogenase C-terminal domain-containing protein [Bryobacteraceae bacterium]|nr:phosphogluconate dehydrogenase C-terminal domain-containing protein [Bryobacteraceae bacterium]